MTDRLTKADWIRHGLRTLAKAGPNGLKVGPMADALAVSRGSFYWHFQDLTDFRAQLLQAWRASTTDLVIEEGLAEPAEPDRLRSLLRRAFNMTGGLDRAVRSWGAHDAEVAAAVAETDARRIAYIAAIIAATGVDGERALDRARFLYWAFLGQTAVMSAPDTAIGAEALDEIAARFET